ncbi:hypothetical protein BJV74DRAFT_799753 [Russula compacta]|nr:hypothetical protein BJV74DRAFT_799753 [Russula compacta]
MVYTHPSVMMHLSTKIREILDCRGGKNRPMAVGSAMTTRGVAAAAVARVVAACTAWGMMKGDDKWGWWGWTCLMYWVLGWYWRKRARATEVVTLLFVLVLVLPLVTRKTEAEIVKGCQERVDAPDVFGVGMARKEKGEGGSGGGGNEQR